MDEALDEQGRVPSWKELYQTALGDNADREFLAEIEALKATPHRLTVSIGRAVMNTCIKDPAYRKFTEFSWEELIDILVDQVQHNRLIRLSSEEDAEDLLPVSGLEASSMERPFGQLPCTLRTARKRVEQAKKLCSPNDPILLLGDDDMVSVELAKAGFRDVTAVDIDMKVISDIASEARQAKLPISLFLHDLTELPPADLIGYYKLVFMDPSYSIPGITSFLKAALGITENRSKTFIFLSVHLMSLLKKGVTGLEVLLDELGFDVLESHPGFNAYPIPGTLRGMISIVNHLVIRSKALMSEGAGFPFFTSDALLLQKR